MSDAGAAFKCLLEVLNQLGIPYVAGGSLASSAHGTPRATADIDLVVDIGPAHARPLAAALEDEFFADQEMIAGSIEEGRAFNLIHYASGYKFDLFPLPDEPYYRVEFERREPAEFTVGEEPLRFDVVTAEDAILTKLVWYRLAGEVSERHWNDASAMVQVQGDKLDEAYLRKWSVHLEGRRSPGPALEPGFVSGGKEAQRPSTQEAPSPRSGRRTIAHGGAAGGTVGQRTIREKQP